MKTVQIFKAMCARASSLHVAAALVGLLALGCASTPLPPTQAMQAAEMAIENAERTRVPDYASPELNEAREKLSAARDAVQDRHMVSADRLAKESRADAELASAKTEVAKAQAVNDDMQKSIDTLKQELQRNSGAGQ